MERNQAGIQLFLQNKWTARFFSKVQLGQWSSDSVSVFLRSYLTVVLTILFNLLFLWLIVVIGRNNRFTKYSRFHRFVLNNTFAYLLLNMVLIPALAISFGSTRQ